MLKSNSRISFWSLTVFLSAFLGAMGLVSFLTGCAGFNRGVKGLVSDDRPTLTRYSDQENVRFQSDRKYRRMNKNKFEDEAEVNAQAGSLWVMEGQGAYLFAQNQTRMLGDLLNIRIEGNPKSQLSSKTKVISKLLERLETPTRGLATAQAAKAVEPTPAAGTPATPSPEGAEAAKTAGAEKAGTFDPKDPINTVQNVPTRIVEQLKDGSYRVKGVQPFMIGKREYKVIVTGVVRPEDFDDSGIDSSKLLDSQFDIVSSRKGAAL